MRARDRKYFNCGKSDREDKRAERAENDSYEQTQQKNKDKQQPGERRGKWMRTQKNLREWLIAEDYETLQSLWDYRRRKNGIYGWRDEVGGQGRKSLSGAFRQARSQAPQSLTLLLYRFCVL